MHWNCIEQLNICYECRRTVRNRTICILNMVVSPFHSASMWTLRYTWNAMAISCLQDIQRPVNSWPCKCTNFHIKINITILINSLLPPLVRESAKVSIHSPVEESHSQIDVILQSAIEKLIHQICTDGVQCSYQFDFNDCMMWHVMGTHWLMENYLDEVPRWAIKSMSLFPVFRERIQFRFIWIQNGNTDKWVIIHEKMSIHSSSEPSRRTAPKFSLCWLLPV